MIDFAPINQLPLTAAHPASAAPCSPSDHSARRLEAVAEALCATAVFVPFSAGAIALSCSLWL